MTNGPACPQCGAIVEAHWDWCHACGFDPEGLMPSDLGSTIPAASGAVPRNLTAPPPTASAPTMTPRWDSDWNPAPTAVKPNRVSKVFATIGIILGGLVVLAVAAFLLVGPRIHKSVLSTKSGAGASDPVAYTSPDGTYSAKLSGTPKVEDQPGKDGEVLHTWGWDGGANAQVIVSADFSADLPAGALQEALEPAVRKQVTGKGLVTPTTFEGHPAFNFEGTFDGLDGHGLAFIDDHRLYFVVAGGPWAGNDPQATAFLQSFTLAPAH